MKYLGPWWVRIREGWRDGWSRQCYRCGEYRQAWRNELATRCDRPVVIQRVFVREKEAREWVKVMSNLPKLTEATCLHTMIGWMGYVKCRREGTDEEVKRWANQIADDVMELNATVLNQHSARTAGPPSSSRSDQMDDTISSTPPRLFFTSSPKSKGKSSSSPRRRKSTSTTKSSAKLSKRSRTGRRSKKAGANRG